MNDISLHLFCIKSLVKSTDIDYIADVILKPMLIHLNRPINKFKLLILFVLYCNFCKANLDSNRWNFGIEIEKLYPIFNLHDESFDKKLQYYPFLPNDPSFALKSTFNKINSPISFTFGCQVLSRYFEIHYINPTTLANTTAHHLGTIYSIPIGINYTVYTLKNTKIMLNLNYEYNKIYDIVFIDPKNNSVKVDYVYKGSAFVVSSGFNIEQMIYKNLSLTLSAKVGKQLGDESTSSINSINRYIFGFGLKYNLKK